MGRLYYSYQKFASRDVGIQLKEEALAWVFPEIWEVSSEEIF